MQRTTSHTATGPSISAARRISALASLLLLTFLIVLSGCGGGYAGTGITSLSASSVTIDAGQSFSITANSATTVPLTWSLKGASCTGAACGSITGTGATAVYTAPESISAQIVVTVTASIPYTQNSSTTTITVNPAPTITGDTPSGTVGVAYSAKITASGGTGTLKLSLASGTLPAGLTFNATTGVISGTPTTAATSNFTLQVVDQSDVPYTATAPRQIVIGTASISLTASGTPPAGTVGVAYSSSLTAAGGTAPYTWSIISGSLPAGLSLSAGGTISGTPTVAGTSTATAQVQDAAGNKATVALSIKINSGAAVITISSPTPPTVNVPYVGTIPVSGGTAPYTCTILAGSLPAGLVLGPNCQLSGTPTAPGATTVTVQATDSATPTNTGSNPIVITVNGSTSTLTAGGNPPAGTIGTPYTATLVASGGTAPYVWSITSGSLPAGLTLSTGGVISGTPTAAGVSTFTAMVQDAMSSTASVTLSITINTGGSAVTITTSSLPNGTVGTPYSAVVGASGGTSPYTCGIVSGSLPAGLSFGAGCTVTGTPTIAGTSTPVIRVTDSGNPIAGATGPITIVINPAPAVIMIASPPVATVNVPYTGNIPVSGGTGPYSCSLTSGTLPAGLVLNSNCVVTGTPTTAGPSTVTVKATDSSSPVQTGSGPVTITVNPGTITLTLGTPPVATVNVPYTGTIPVSGGTGPYACSITSGILPAGLTLGANCTITGTPTTPGAATVTVKATDSATPADTGTSNVTVTVNAAAITLTLGTPPAATVNSPYTGAIPVSGGTGPYTCALTGGTLPAGLTLGANCVITGTPTTAGPSTITVKATDSATPTANTGTGAVTVTVNPSPITLTLGTPPAATVSTPYTGTIPVSGGTGPYTCALTGGTLPAGLTLGANCVITGTPTTAGPSTITVKATDSATPTANTGTGSVVVTVNAGAPTLTLGTPPAATVNIPYTGTIPVTGGTAPYTCALTGGTLPAGLTLGANCVVTGTPTTAGTSTITVKATDSSSPAGSNSGSVTLTVNPSTVVLSFGVPPAATVGTVYSGAIPVTGGTAPYTCALTGGTLPAGLTLGTNCVITGTPTTAGSATITVKATDSATPTANTGTGSVVVTVNPAPITLTLGTPPAATVNTPYTGTIPVSNGTAPYTCALTSGTLPAGLTLGTNCVITGTPTTAGSATITVKATDSATPTANTGSGTVVVTVNPAPITLTLGNPPTATVNTPYIGLIPVSGGTTPYTCALSSGTMPAGLTLGANCTITGTPTTAATTTVNVTATDSATPANTKTGPVVITVQPITTLTLTGTLPNAIVNVAYTQTLHAAGGLAPYTYAITAGSLPAGLNLSTAGVISGTPTTVGASSFTVTATDSEGTPQTASLPLVLLVTYPVTPYDGLLKGPYAYLFQGYDDVIAGVLAYQTATAASFTSDGAGVLNAGELDSNHQNSNPTGNTISSNGFLGTYTLGADGRGSMAITTLNANGTTANTITYAIALKLPTAPATVATSGSLIESDGNLLVATKGSGTLLQQTTSAFAAGLTGNYAFGLQGDTPCLPSCTIGLTPGPVVSVGQFTAAGGAISGTGDTNVSTTNVPASTLGGSYVAADGNGRVQLTLTTSKLAGQAFPTDYAVYLVDASHAFLLSTDKHSSFVLQAGTATAQTQATFSNASMGAPFVGYENAAANPGLASNVLTNVLNLSSATIFRGTGNGNGTCTTTNVDVGGLTGLVNSLTGLGSNSSILNALLGTYQSLGNSNCAVSPNGRVVLNYPNPNTVLSGLLGLLGLGNTPPPARIAYLTSPNTGYFLESGYAGLGMLEAQTGPGGKFTLGTLKGSFVYDTIPAATLATINSTGNFTADGAGNATTTLDTNIGVGNLNLIQLGVSGSATYTLTDDTAGRYLLGGTRVIYAIAPGRYVLLETNALSTSPYIALLY